MSIVAGVDIGSTTTKAVIFQDNKPIGSAVNLTGSDCNVAAEHAINTALNHIKLDRTKLDYIVSTGYGRRSIDFGNESVTEITANAKGAVFLGSPEGPVKSIIDIGGQDTKAILLDDNGQITNFAMNDKCAAGTGRFLEVISRVLQEKMDNFVSLGLKSTNPVTINSTCTVFAESEVISLIAKKVKKEDIIAGIHKSVAKRVSDLAKGAGVKPVIFFDGGGARNLAMKKMIELELGTKIYIPKVPQIVVALGAAVIASEKVKNSKT